MSSHPVTSRAAFPNPVVTFLPVYRKAVLIVKRHRREPNFPGLWAFPGGKVEIGETLIAAMVRELLEETGLRPSGKIAFLNTYQFGMSVGITFAIKVRSDHINASDLDEWRWLHSEAELRSLPRIAGIDNHYRDLQAALATPQRWVTLTQANLLPETYLNT